ncbi:MAG TPA: hypothetical protein VGQ10_07870 [Vicinamibacterales bacterium]|jgi:hypothetical protein|nr:hypothetical protein [Vicinamibacterales bacterium]
MSRRYLALLGVGAVIVLAVLFRQLSLMPVSGQERSTNSAASAGSASKTPWGEPDLQGIWTRETEVPLQRPAKYANKEFFTEEERAALDRQRSEIIGREANEERRKRGTEQDVGGAYNQAIFISHLRLGKRTSLIVDPPNGRMPPFTPEEQKRRAEIVAYTLALVQATDLCKNKLPGCEGGKYGPPSPKRNETPPHYLTGGQGGPGGGGGVINRSDGPEDRGNSERCMSAALPDFGGFRRIVQSRGQVSIFYDTGQGQGWQRVVPITTTPHLPANVRLWWGDSRGRWEGNTLVVDVTNFSPKANFNGSHENLHLVERWTRLDANTIEYAVTVEDPSVWTRPWTVKQELKKQNERDNRIFYEPRCHEGNYGMPALLAGARADELAFKLGKGPDPATICLGGCGGFSGGFADDGDDANPLR